MNNYKNHDKRIWLYGKHTLESIMASKSRQIYKILCSSQNHEDVVNIIAKNKGRELLKLVQIADRAEISNLLGDVNHQSVAINCLRKPILAVDNLLSDIKSGADAGNILVLDQLTDPQNIGAIIRSAAAFAIKNIIVPGNSFPQETASMVKAASGNFEKVEIYSTNNITNLLSKIKKLDYWCVGLAGESKDSIEKVKDFDKIVIITGSEGSGIRPLIKKNCDLLLKIPMESQVESLNASNATTIALYELYKNRR